MAKVNYSMLGTDGNITLKGFNWTIEHPLKNLIIVTGMEEYAGRYDELATYLNAFGYNVVCLDHYGQGQTAGEISKLGKTIKGAFSFSVDNIHKLAETLKAQNGLPVYVMGHSMGSFITQTYIQKYSEDVTKAIIVGSNGNNAKLLYKFGSLFTKLKVKDSNWNKPGTTFENITFGSYRKRFPDSAFDWVSASKANVEEYTRSKYCGYGSTMGFYYELLDGNSKLFIKKNLQKIRKDLPILIISGEDDPVGSYGKGPTKLAKMYEKLGISDVSLKLYPGLRHEILQEESREEIFKDVADFLEK